ncbi:hypothetical protein BGZ46_003310, partial [Entomortierella lignicola]
MTQKIKLFCVLDGDSTAFPLNLASDDTIGDLKDSIHKKKSNALEGIDASDLLLWQVSIPIGSDEEEDKPIYLEDYKDEAKRIGPKHAATEISEVFGTAPAKKTIHVIVQRPSA